MKKLYFLSLLLISGVVSAQCNYTLTLTDSYGDGWNGNKLEVTYGTTVDTVTLADPPGNTTTILLTVNTGDTINLNYLGGGSFNGEVSFELEDPNGAILFSSGSGPSTGFLYGTSAICVSCPRPTNVMVTGISSTTANVSWTTGGASNWNIEYGPTGFAHGSGTFVYNVTNPYTISGLSANTSYDVYVQDSCGVADVSVWSDLATFTTDLAACSSLSPITLPFIEDFETFDTTIIGQSNVFCSTDRSWNFYTSDNTYGRLRFGTDSPINNGGNGAALLDVNTDGNYVTNGLVLTLDMSNYSSMTDNIFLSFDYGDWGDETDTEDRFWVRGSNSDSWIEIYNWSGNTEDTWHTEVQAISITDILTNATQTYSSTFQIKFGQYDNYSFNSDGLSLDNIKLEVVTCPMPSGLSSIYQNEDSVVLSWTAGASETMWNIEYGPYGFTQGTGTMVSGITATTDTIDGLALGSVYEFYVQADCGSGDASIWVGPIVVTTMVLNDSTCEAILVEADVLDTVFSNVNTSIQTGESALSGSQYNTVWFKTVVPASGHLLIATCNSDFSTIVGAYTYDTLDCTDFNTFGQLAYSSSGYSICGVYSRGSVEICGQTPGDTILFYVGGSSSSQEGLIKLTVLDWGVDGMAGQPASTIAPACAGDTINLWNDLTGQATNAGTWDYPLNPSAIVDDSLLNTGALSISGLEVYYIVSNSCDADTATIPLNVATMTHSGTAVSNFQACNAGDVYLFDGLTGTIDAGGTWNDDTNTGLLVGNKFVAAGLPVGQYQFTYSVNNGVCPPASTQVTVELVDCTNITEEGSADFAIYPNPNNGTFYVVNGNTDSKVALEVIDVQGKVVYSGTYTVAANAQQEVTLNNVVPGMYIVKVITNNKVFNHTVMVK